jgi:hypothetical protein
MNFNGFIKRAFIFLAAFAVGITATGLLVGFDFPKWGRGHRGHKKHYVKKLKAEKQRLEAENEELRRELELHRSGEAHGAGIPLPPPPPMAPLPPPPRLAKAPHAHN